MEKNHWSEFDYSKFKLFLRPEKVNSILNVLTIEKEFDDLPPISVELHLTDICNLKCSWCTDSKLRKNLASIKKDNVFKLFDYFKEKDIGVTIEGGGEPSIHNDFEEIVQYGKSLDLHMGLISNGVENFSHVIKYFKWVRISIDASSPTEYKQEKGIDRFEVVLSNLGNFSKNRDPSQTHLGVGYVLTKRNINSVMNIVPTFDKLGADYLYLRPVEESPQLVPSLDDLFNLRKQLLEFTETHRIKAILNINERLIKNNDNLPCIAHSLTCIIQANGEVMLCEKRRHDIITFGNIYEEDFDKIWNSNTRKKVTNKLLNPLCQIGCEVCRITPFNRIFFDVNNIHTKKFI